MRKIIAITFLALILGAPILAAKPKKAYWTNKFWKVRAENGKLVTKCEYKYEDQLIYHIFVWDCAPSVDVK